MTDNKILKLVNDNKWNVIMDMIKNNKVNPNTIIKNGNNIYHMACIKGNTKAMKYLMKLDNINLKNTNDEGMSGIHLYYKYGGEDSSFLDTIQTCNIDNNGNTIIKYIIDNIVLVEKFINMLIKNKCIENIELTNENNEYIFYKLSYKITNIKDSKIKEKYFKLLEKLYISHRTKDLVFIAIFFKNKDIIKMLIKHKFDFVNVIQNNTKYTTILACVELSLHDIVEIILKEIKNKHNNYEVYNIINRYAKSTHINPIFLSIQNNDDVMLKILIKYMTPYIRKKHILFNQIDRYRNLYIHRILLSDNKKFLDNDIVSFFIKYSDMNYQNYDGNTPAHLLFNKNIWVQYIDLLKTKNIDYELKNYNDKNCKKYVKEKDKDIFKQLKNNKNNNDNKKYNINSLLDINNKNEPKNYGLFNSDSVHYMLYVKYLENKYDNIYIPKITYNKKDHKNVIFYNKINKYFLNKETHFLDSLLTDLLELFYSYHPSTIIWCNEDVHYISPKLGNVLKKNIKENHRYVLLKITIILNNGDGLHAGCLLYDKHKKNAWRFEPYGMTNYNNIDNKYEKTIDYYLENILKDVYGKINYYDPDKYLNSYNFQLISRDEEKKNMNLGDPGGYCLAWTIWFIELILSHQKNDIIELLNNFFNKNNIDKILTEEEKKDTKSSNYYLDYIRRYAHKLDNEKNKLLKSKGIRDYDIYKSVMSKNTENIIFNMFKA
jgi:hypothetical protein